MSGSVGTQWNEYLTVLTSQLDHSAGVVVSIFLASRNHKDGAQADMQYISGLLNNPSFTHKQLSANAKLTLTAVNQNSYNTMICEFTHTKKSKVLI